MITETLTYEERIDPSASGDDAFPAPPRFNEIKEYYWRGNLAV